MNTHTHTHTMFFKKLYLAFQVVFTGKAEHAQLPDDRLVPAEGTWCAVTVCALAENTAFSERQWELFEALNTATGTI